MLVSLFMKGQIEMLDSLTKIDEEDSDNDLDDTQQVDSTKTNMKIVRGPTLPLSDKFYLGARQKKALSLSYIEQEHVDNLAFMDFRKRLTVFVNNYVAVNGITSSSGTYIRLTADHEVILTHFLISLQLTQCIKVYEYRLLKVNYEFKSHLGSLHRLSPLYSKVFWETPL